jgi:hypothetical protein
MLEDASGETPDTAREDACAPKTEAPLPQFYVKEQMAPKAFRAGEHVGPPRDILAEEGKNR